MINPITRTSLRIRRHMAEIDGFFPPEGAADPSNACRRQESTQASPCTRGRPCIHGTIMRQDPRQRSCRTVVARSSRLYPRHRVVTLVNVEDQQWSRRQQPTRWSLTSPIDCAIAYIVVGPTNVQPCAAILLRGRVTYRFVLAHRRAHVAGADQLDIVREECVETAELGTQFEGSFRIVDR